MASPPASNPFPIGEAIRLAVCPFFIKYCEQHVAVRERISMNVSALIAGRSGLVISAPIISTINGLEFRRVSILTKEGVVECQNVPIKLIKHDGPQAAAMPADTDGGANVHAHDDKEAAVDEHFGVRGHLLRALTDSTCRSGRHPIIGKVDAKKSNEILTALKNELNTKKVPLPPLLHTTSVTDAPSPDEDDMSDSTPEPINTFIAHKLIGDSEGQFAPIGTCFLNINDYATCKNTSSDANDKMFSIKTTLIQNYPATEQYLNDVIRNDETSDKFTATVKDMIIASDKHAKTMKQKHSLSVKKSINIQKHLHRRKYSSNNNNNINRESSLEDASNSEFIFLNGIAEVNGENSLHQYSDSINSLSTAATSPLQRKHQQVSQTQPPYPQPNSQTSPPHQFTPKPPNIAIKISHLQSNDKGRNKETDTERKERNATKETKHEISCQKQASDWEALISRFAQEDEVEVRCRPETTPLQRFLQESGHLLAGVRTKTILPKQQTHLDRDIEEEEKQKQEKQKHLHEQEQTGATDFPVPSSSSSSSSSDIPKISQYQQRLTASNVRINKNKKPPVRPCQPRSSRRGPRICRTVSGTSPRAHTHRGATEITDSGEKDEEEQECKAKALVDMLLIAPTPRN